jgi:uncharacterized protein YggL (DUF469 family)
MGKLTGKQIERQVKKLSVTELRELVFYIVYALYGADLDWGADTLDEVARVLRVHGRVGPK